MADGGTARRRLCDGCGRRWWAVQPPEQEVEGWRLVWKYKGETRSTRKGMIVALLPLPESTKNKKV